MQTASATICGDIGAITSLGNDVFAMRLRGKQVRVYDVSDILSVKRTGILSVPGLLPFEAHCGLAACNQYQCLYVSNLPGNAVHRLELGGSRDASKWAVPAPRGLSINHKHNVLVSSTDGIYEYSTRGQLIRQIEFDHRYVFINHAVQISTDYLEITLEGLDRIDRSNRSMFSMFSTANGRHDLLIGLSVDTLRSTSSSPVEVKCGYGIATSLCGFVFIADTCADQIVVFNPNTREYCVLPVPPSCKLRYPTCLCMDDLRDRLYVGEYGQRRMNILDKVSRMLARANWKTHPTANTAVSAVESP